MPTIPRFHAPDVSYPTDIPNIPTGIVEGGPADTLQKVGSDLSRVGFALDEKLQDIRKVQELGNAQINGEKQLSDLHWSIVNSPDFVRNPEAAAKRYEDEAAKIHSTIGGQITDPMVKSHFDLAFQRDVLRASQTVREAARKQRIVSADADRIALRQNYINMAIAAQDETQASDYLNKYAQHAGRLVATGAWAANDAQKDILKAQSDVVTGRAKADILRDPDGAYQRIMSRQGIYKDINEQDAPALERLAQDRKNHLEAQGLRLQKAAKEEAKQLQLNNALKEVQTYFPGDTEAQAKYVENSANYPDMDVNDRKALVGMVNEVGNRERKQREEDQKATDNQVFSDFLSPTGKIKTEADIKASGARPELQQHLIDITKRNYEDRFKTDPAVEADTLRKIWNKEITQRSQLAPLIANGLSPDKAEEMGKSIDVANDPSKSKYVSMAADLFKAKYKDDDEMMSTEPNFLFLLDWHVKYDNDGKGLKGGDIYLKAQELMKSQEEKRWYNWFKNSTKPNFQRELEAPPWLKMPAASPESYDIYTLDGVPSSSGRVTSSSPVESTSTQEAWAAEPPNETRVSTPEERKTFDAIPAPLRAQFVDVLNNYRMPVTDKNIQGLYDQYKGHMGQ